MAVKGGLYVYGKEVVRKTFRSEMDEISVHYEVLHNEKL
jgi:hypothetical protein